MTDRRHNYLVAGARLRDSYKGWKCHVVARRGRLILCSCGDTHGIHNQFGYKSVEHTHKRNPIDD